MIIQAFQLLRKLKKAQIELDEFVYIDHDALTASTVHESGKPCKVVKLKAYRTSLDSTLRYLQNQEYINCDDDCTVVQVMYSGWHFVNAMISDFIKFMINSIAVPIGVSIATTLVTLWIQSLLAA